MLCAVTRSRGLAGGAQCGGGVKEASLGGRPIDARVGD
jgi:hypothetical protein